MIEIPDEQLNCAEVELGFMYPDRDDRLTNELAKAVCVGCVIIDECREDAIESHEFGVWGGTSEKDRISIIRKRQRWLQAVREDA